MTKGFIGAAMGPLIDVDHVVAAFGYTSAVRDGHSLILLAALILLVGWPGLWNWGAVDFALFSTAEFLGHFTVAPPGFPLLSPVFVSWFELPRWTFLLATALCLTGAWVSRRK